MGTRKEPTSWEYELSLRVQVPKYRGVRSQKPWSSICDVMHPLFGHLGNAPDDQLAAFQGSGIGVFQSSGFFCSLVSSLGGTGHF